MNTTLAVVVSAIVILITALVVITMFGQSMGNFSSISDAKNFCLTTFTATCSATGSLPTGIQVTINSKKQNCISQGLLLSSCKCENNGLKNCEVKMPPLPPGA